MLSAQTLCETVSCVPVNIVHGEEPEALAYIVTELRALGWQ